MYPTIGVLLAGGLRASPLCAALERNVLTLPLQRGRTLLHGWLDCLATDGLCETICIVVSSSDDEAQVLALLAEVPGPAYLAIDVLIDPRPWRGTAGVLRDVTSGYDHEAIAVGEGMCLPPSSLAPLLTGLGEGAGAVVGVGPEHEPAGIYAFRRPAFAHVPDEGFFDLKEQLLPLLHASDLPARPVATGASTIRVRDRSTYLDAVAASTIGGGAPDGDVVYGHSLVDSTAVIDPTAIVYDSVVINGARVGAGAVVCRSVIDGVALSSNEQVRDTIRSGQHTSPSKTPRVISRTLTPQDVPC